MKKKLSYYLEDTSRLKEVSLSDLQSWMSEYPYSQNLKMLYVKKLKQEDQISIQGSMHNLALTSPHPKSIFEIATSFPEGVSTVSISKDSKKVKAVSTIPKAAVATGVGIAAVGIASAPKEKIKEGKKIDKPEAKSKIKPVKAKIDIDSPIFKKTKSSKDKSKSKKKGQKISVDIVSAKDIKAAIAKKSSTKPKKLKSITPKLKGLKKIKKKTAGNIKESEVASSKIVNIATSAKNKEIGAENKTNSPPITLPPTKTGAENIIAKTILKRQRVHNLALKPQVPRL